MTIVSSHTAPPTSVAKNTERPTSWRDSLPPPGSRIGHGDPLSRACRDIELPLVPCRGQVDLQGRRPTAAPRPVQGAAGGVFLGIRTGPKCVSSAVDDDVEVPPAEGHETEAPAPTAEMRRCDGCGSDFQSARPWSRFCSPACRLRAHRRLARDTRTQKPATISESAFP